MLLKEMLGIWEKQILKKKNQPVEQRLAKTGGALQVENSVAHKNGTT